MATARRRALAFGRWLAIAALPTAALASSDAAAQAVSRGNARFAIELFGKLRTQPGNLFFSPFSVSTAAGMAYAGARGTTASEMANALHFPVEPANIGSAYHEMLEQLRRSSGSTVRVANGLWVAAGETPLAPYTKTIDRDFNGRFETLDFAGANENSRLAINAWVEKQTSGKIRDLFAANTIDPLTRLVLVSAVYFKADWVNAFPKKATREMPFRSGSSSTEVPTMHQIGSFGYRDAGSYKVLELPYRTSEMAMLILLPRTDAGLLELEASLTVAALTDSVRHLPRRNVAVWLPRFMVTSAFNLVQPLRELGMHAAFDDRQADFSGITSRSDLFIGSAVHKAFVEVDEEGTEAAAATGITQTRSEVAISTSFVADHPFLFVIRSTRDDSILFMGRITTVKP